MHKSLVSSFSILLVLAAGCGGDEVLRGKADTGGLSAADYNRLVDLNRMQQDNIDAREYAHHGFTTLAISEKAKAMGQKIASPNCVLNGRIPDDDLNGQIHEAVISGTECPIYWFRRRGWTIANKIMVIADRLVIEDEKYRKDYAPMAVRSLEGSYSIILDSTGHRIYGNIKINEFQTTAYGRIEGGIAVDYRKKNDDGTGAVSMTLKGKGWASAAAITWTVRRNGPPTVTYRINNKKVDEAQFNDLFSSYELDKYMDNALKMK